jgi:hypothetical protein
MHGDAEVCDGDAGFAGQVTSMTSLRPISLPERNMKRYFAPRDTATLQKAPLGVNSFAHPLRL